MDKQFLDKTKKVWQKYYDKPLSDEDARQIIENSVGFLNLLIKKRKEVNKGSKF